MALKQIWFPSGEELGADDISGRGAYTRRYLSINYSPPGASDEPALNVEHTPIDSGGLDVPGLKVFAGPFSVGDAILVEKVVQTGNYFAAEYQGDDYFTIAGDGDTWTQGTIEAEQANAGGIVAAVDGTTALDLTAGNCFTCTPAENTSWSTSAPTNGIGGQRVSFVVNNSGGYTVAWAAGFTNVTPIWSTQTGVSIRTVQFNGTTWYQIGATHDGKSINSGMETIDGTIYFPDAINSENAEVELFRFDDLVYPYGVTLVAAQLSLPGDAAYTVVLEEWLGDPPVHDTDLVTLTTTGSESFKEVLAGGMSATALAANSMLYAHIPATDVSWIKFKVFYTVDLS